MSHLLHVWQGRSGNLANQRTRRFQCRSDPVQAVEAHYLYEVRIVKVEGRRVFQIVQL
jgi:hypothetical protein